MIALLLLGLLGMQEPDVEALLKQLEDESIEVREKAASALVDLGDKAEALLGQRLDGAQGEIRVRYEAILKSIERRRKLRSVLPPVDRFSFQARNRALPDVLAEMCEKAGATLNRDGLPEKLITLDLRDVTLLEAFEAVCRQAGSMYVLETPPFEGKTDRTLYRPRLSIRFVAAPLPKADFIRHYRIRPAGISVFRNSWFAGSDRGTSVTLGIQWAPHVRPARIGRAEILAVTDDRGRSLLPKTGLRSPHAGFSARLDTRPFDEYTLGVQGLNYPEPDARSIASLKGKLVMQYLLAEETLLFDNPAKDVGQTRERAGVSIRLNEFRVAGGEAFIDLGITGRIKDTSPEKPPGWRPGPVDPETGIRLKLSVGTFAAYRGGSHGPIGRDDTWRITTRYAVGTAEIESLQIEVNQTFLEDVVEFELKDIPLPE
jgi:hypothetical protein